MTNIVELSHIIRGRGENHLASLVYIAIGLFDQIAVFVLALALYRMPIRGYRLELFVLVVWLATQSYVVRLILDVPGIDLP
ncbi:MAG: hypothetical protein K6T85_12815, partial [Gorillibacterium sp.]|nr:hypothetical protein [Gorillibacterium sp.]